MDTVTEWASIITTSLLAVVGLYLVHSARRRIAQDVAARRLEAYAELWEALEVAAPSRLTDPQGAGPISPSERRELFTALTRWYYRGGNGMLLPQTTRNVYLTAKDNLVCRDDDLRPPEVAVDVLGHDERDLRRGETSIEQLSLLRSVMRFDIGQFARPYLGGIDPLGEAFLAHCGIDLDRRPWRRARRRGEP